jgi:hypothetical protein
MTTEANCVRPSVSSRNAISDATESLLYSNLTEDLASSTESMKNQPQRSGDPPATEASTIGRCKGVVDSVLRNLEQ